MVSRKAAQGLWSKLSQWWAARDAEPVVEVKTNAPAMSDAAPPAPVATREPKAPRAQPSARRGKKG